MATRKLPADPLLKELLKMDKFEYHLIPLSQWRARVILMVGGTYEQHVEAFRKNLLTRDEQVFLATDMRDYMRHNAAAVYQPASRPRRQFVYFPSNPDLTKGDVVGTIAHEMLHVTVALLKNAGVRLNDGSEETYTYLQGYLVEQVFCKLSKAKTPARQRLPSPKLQPSAPNLIGEPIENPST